jgi:predicted ATPase
VLAEALATVDQHGERFYEAELHRLKGEVLLACSVEPHTEVQARFHRALLTARDQQAKSLELRAAMSLSRLRQRQGQCDEARQLLAPIYGWFTEGVDSVDLKEAKALIEELS